MYYNIGWNNTNALYIEYITLLVDNVKVFNIIPTDAESWLPGWETTE